MNATKKQRIRKLKMRSGFAFPDLIVLLAMAAVAVSALLPAMQTVRERLRKEDCANRLREIAFATHLYHAVNEHLPATLGPTGAIDSGNWFFTSFENQHTSALAHIAPFMGLSNLFDGTDPLIFDFDNDLTFTDYANTSDFWFGEDSINSSVVQDLPEFTCPSDNINELQLSALFTSSLFTNDPANSSLGTAALVNNTKNPVTPARTNYVGCTGASSGGLNLTGDHRNHIGSIGWRERVPMFIFPDGLSNTVMFGENIGTIQISEAGEFQRDFTSYWFFGAASQMRGAVRWRAKPPLVTTTGNSGFFSIFNAATPDYPDPSTEPDPSQGILGHAKHARTQGFGSMHPAGVNFVFLDGSVRTVGRTDDWQSLYAIGGGFDSVNDFQLSRPGIRE